MKTPKHVDVQLERLFNLAHSLRHDGLITEEGLRRMLAGIDSERPKVMPQGEIVRFSARVKSKTAVSNWDSIPADDRLALPIWTLVSWLANPTTEKIGYCLEQLKIGLDKVHPGEFDKAVFALRGEDEVEFELHCNDEYAASATGPRERAWAEIQHYAIQYAQDGPVKIYEVRRALAS